MPVAHLPSLRTLLEVFWGTKLPPPPSCDSHCSWTSGHQPLHGAPAWFQTWCIGTSDAFGTKEIVLLSRKFSQGYSQTHVWLRVFSFAWFPGGSEVKASACNAGDLGSIPGLGRSRGEGNGNPLQYSCLETPMDGRASWATVHGVAKNRTWLRDFTFTFKCSMDTC